MLMFRRMKIRMRFIAIGLLFVIGFSFVAYIDVIRNFFVASDAIDESTQQKGPFSSNENEKASQSQSKPSLTFKDRTFYLDGEQLQILSGAVHYFRVPQEYWHDRLLKLKAAGLNTVETYAPWNLHEEQKGNMNFNGMLNVRKFFKLAQQLGLHVIFRPGPYICSEWEFGGMPAWLLADPNMRVRSMYVKFTKAADNYLRMIMAEVRDLQHIKGGPIIAFQIENEYGNYGENPKYLGFLADAMRRYGAVEAFFTSDGNDGIAHTQRLPGAFMGVNYNEFAQGKRLISVIKAKNKDLPVFATELWTGWFLGWGAKSDEAIGVDDLLKVTKSLLDEKASINFYMFHGGTNFGFMNGFNGFSREPLITSYDYGAPLTEHGLVTEKYRRLRELVLSVLPKSVLRSLPELPPPTPTKEYGRCKVQSSMKWENLVDLVEKGVSSNRIKFMEEVHQNFGFILYRSSFKKARSVTIEGRVADRALVLVNGAAIDAAKPEYGVVYHATLKTAPPSTTLSLENAIFRADSTLDVLVENLGRANYATFQSDMFNMQRKGIYAVKSDASDGDDSLQMPGAIALDGVRQTNYMIVPLDFSKSYLAKVSVSKDSWTKFSATETSGAPGLYRLTLEVGADEEPRDTFVDMSEWKKGVVFVNGFNLGRYWNVGPQMTLYLPAPVLRRGANEVLIFELHKPASSVVFVKNPISRFSPAP